MLRSHGGTAAPRSLHPDNAVADADPCRFPWSSTKRRRENERESAYITAPDPFAPHGMKLVELVRGAISAIPGVHGVLGVQTDGKESLFNVSRREYTILIHGRDMPVLLQTDS